MGCDMVVAIGRATVDGGTLFGHNSALPERQCQVLRRIRGRPFALGETVRVQYVELPQARQTYTVVGSQPDGCWGYAHGVNEHQVAAGCTAVSPRLTGEGPGLLGADLVRLALERSRSARQAVDCVTELIQRHGRATPPRGAAHAETDHALLIADPREAFAVESAGPFWVAQEVGEVRAASDVRVVRQDWDRIAPGLAEYAIALGRWPADGSKLDFAGALRESAPGQGSGWRRWGRATLLLEQQNGHIDGGFVRRLLSDHYEGTDDEVDPLDAAADLVPLCQHATGRSHTVTAASLVAQLHADAAHLPVAWCAFGPPCSGVYFPVFLHGELPEPFTAGGPEGSADSLWWRLHRLHAQLRGDADQWAAAHDGLARLQARFDQDAADFAAEAAGLRERGDLDSLSRLATTFMQHTVERFETLVATLMHESAHAVTVSDW
jgi:secernin